MTIAMKNTGDGSNEQETTAPSVNQNANQNNTGDVNTADSQMASEVEDENLVDPVTGEPYFPVNELIRLEEMISRTRWVVPVLPKCELEILLDASILLCKKGLDTRSDACQRFFQEGLTKSFTKVLTDEAVSSWKYDIHRCILQNCYKLVELCVTKLSQDWFPLLDLLAMVLNPHCKFHSFNLTRPSESVPPNVPVNEDEIFSKPLDVRAPRGWLVDLINRFGKLNGFQILLERFQSGQNLTLPVMYALMRPFGLCAEMLTVPTIVKYFLPIIEVIPAFLDNLTDEELKKEAKNEGKNDVISAIVKFLKNLAARVPNQEETLQNLEMFRLKMILRLLQISSFNGKMNALNEINKVIASVSTYPQRAGQSIVGGANEAEEEWLTAERMAGWLKEHKVLQIVLSDSLHQPQYVEKLEKILRFVIKEKALTLDDLDRIWASQVGKHEAIVKNVHDLLAKLAWDFSPEQLDHLFECFQASWTTAGKKQREKLLELIRRLAEDDKDGVMAHKVLTLFWNLAHSPDVPNEIMDQAMNAHVKILDYSCSQDRDAQKTHWLDRCVEEIRQNQWVLQALKQIRDICLLYSETPANYNHAAPHAARAPNVLYRQEVVNRLQQQHALVILITDNLCGYMDRIRALVKDNAANYDPQTFMPDDRYSHVMQVQERLNFLRFLLKDGQLWLCAPQARQIWNCLVENAIFVADREACFKWFSKLMGEEPDLDPEVNKEFFENQILRLDPALMTESGMKCFDRFFNAVNAKEGRMVARRKINDVDLIGLDYLWRVILSGTDSVADKAILLLKETYTGLGPRLINSQVEIHEDLISSCIDRLRASHDTLRACLYQKQQQQNEAVEKDFLNRTRQETARMCRVLKLLQDYVTDYDCDFQMREERTLLPLGRAFRGKNFMLIIRFPNQGRQPEDLELWTHSNETLATVRRHILNRIKSGNVASASANLQQQQQQGLKLDLFLNNELIETTEDFRLVSELHLRDRTLLTAKLSQSNAAAPGSPDSSSDSSTGGSPQHTTNSYQGLTQYSTAAAAENTLPGVLMSRDRRVIPFLCQIADLGCLLKHAQLRDSARNLLRLLPADPQAVDRLFGACRVSRDQQNDDNTSDIPGSLSVLLESIFFGPSASTVLYHLEVAFSLFMPANFPMAEKALEFQYSFIQSGGIPLILNMLRNNSFITSADVQTKRSAFLGVLRLAKVVLTVLSYLCWRDSPEGSANPQQIPLPLSDYFVRAVANQLVPHLQVDSASLCSVKPELSDVHAVIRLAWSSSSNQYKLLNCPWEEMGQYPLPQQKQQQQQQQQQDNEYSEEMQMCKEALEVLTVANFICPHITEQLAEDKTFFRFVLEVVLLCPSKLVRSMAAEQLLQMTTIFPQQQLLQSFITALLSVLHTTAKEFAASSHEYFQLLCRLLSYATSSGIAVPQAEEFLQNEIQWLKKAKDNFVATGSTQAEDELLEGHLSLIREFVSHLGPNKKFEVGTDESKGVLLIRELLEDFLYPASRVMLHYNKTGEMLSVPSDPICASSVSANSALDLLVALSTGCVENMRLLVAMLTDMFFTDEYNEPLTEWEYLPPVGPRPGGSFVGLKNAGATCYMNSVLQQLFMIERLRRGVLSADGAAQDPDEDFSGEDKLENDTDTSEEQQLQQKSREESARDYNVNILKQLQAIFGHLAYSKLQYYVPRGLWRHFKLQGEPVNLREQQDAVEFYMSLTDSVDEALKALNCEQIMGRTLVGVFSDQKICKGCPHRYCKEQPFNVISVDIRNHSNLHDSLEQYVKGELLEGGDAYHCEKCNKKVNTVKRLCVKKLPPILAIQLKRFEYDYERLCPIKFNDYFEFPRVLDMEPYTVWGLAKAEGQVIDYDIDGGEITGGDVCTRYHLTGVVVHSGQASGGHYYSYILQRSPSGEGAKWYKFDDGDVTECKMDDDEEMKNQCFGGEYMGEVFDHVVKRMSYRRQKRWWNAYILFYTREDVDLCSRMSDLSLSDEKLPTPIERSVRKQNNKFQHTFNIFSPEFFQFVRKLVGCNSPIISGEKLGDKPGSQAEELALLSVQIGARFLFNACLHTKKTLRGAANDWYEVLVPALRFSRKARTWLAQKILFAHPQRFSEYLLQCPSAEVRSAFAKILVSLAHFSLGDGPFSPEPNSHSAPTDWSLADHIFHAVLGLLNKEVADYGRHLSQYFNLFLMYASLGPAEKAHLLRLNVPATFMTVALDEGPGPPIKYQYAELGKLYQVVCLLIRCCDVSSKMSSSVAGSSPLVNSLGETPIIPLQAQVAEILYGKNTFVKKLLEDAGASEETAKLLRFCCWENDHFSSTVLSDLLWQIAFAYTYELRPHLDLLLAVLTLEDSWQKHRIMAALRGIPDDRDGLFDIIQRSKSHYHKRGYQCIKFLVALFSQCSAAYQVLLTNGELKRKWAAAVDWLHEELDRRPYAAGNNQYGYNNWSPPAQSNETSNGYFLERSNSARLTLEKAIGLCPEEEQEGEEPPIGDGEEQQTLPPLEEYQQQQVKRPPTISARANQQQQLRGSVPANPALSIPRPTNTQLLSPVHVHQSANRQQQNQQNKNTPADGTIGKATTPPGS